MLSKASSCVNLEGKNVKFFIDSRILDMRNLKPKPKIHRPKQYPVSQAWRNSILGSANDYYGEFKARSADIYQTVTVNQQFPREGISNSSASAAGTEAAYPTLYRVTSSGLTGNTVVDGHLSVYNFSQSPYQRSSSFQESVANAQLYNANKKYVESASNANVTTLPPHGEQPTAAAPEGPSNTKINMGFTNPKQPTLFPQETLFTGTYKLATLSFILVSTFLI